MLLQVFQNYSDINLTCDPRIIDGLNWVFDTTEAMNFPLKHPPFVIRDLEADQFTQRTIFDYDPNLLKKVQKKIKKILNLYGQSKN